MSSTKVKTSPWRSQPKQYQDCICGLTLKLGLSSWWNGHRPQKSLLRLVRRTCSWTTLTRSTLALTSAKASSDAGMGTTLLSVAQRRQESLVLISRMRSVGVAFVSAVLLAGCGSGNHPVSQDAAVKSALTSVVTL